ncbi:MAG: glycosyltransferase [Solirubrobacteraceae bacterium]
MSTPVLSVVMATYGAREWAERALDAVERHTDVPHEVVVVDNASTDGTPDMIRERFPSVRLVENAENTGYGAANNQAASLARAPVLALLNSDAIVPPGWASPLMAALERPDVGAVVPTLVHLDGTLQTAGAVLGADGSVLALGSGADPEDPFYAFARTCDFGAGACMLVGREDFLAVGGFDPVYDPAYFEDADLCLALAARGARTLFVPQVRVAHQQFASSDPARAEELFLRSRTPFLERWGETLAVDRLPSVLPADPARTLAARDALACGRLLVLCGTVLPERDGLDGALLASLSDPGRELRVTLVAGEGDAAAWAHRGAEVVLGENPDALLVARAGHYDVVTGAAGPHLDALRAAQPQAMVAATLVEAARLLETVVAPALA